MNMKWDYKNRTVNVDMKGYIKKVRVKYQHDIPARPENQPNKYTIPNYGEKVKLTEPKDTYNSLGTKYIKRLQEIFVSLLLYGRGVDGKLILT